jgi:phage baseplate assembly protein gpV
VHDHVSQANLSDFDFLKARGREIGYEVAVIDGRLHFSRPARSATGPGPGRLGSEDLLQLVFGQNLTEFRPRVTSAEQVAEVCVRGWDPTQKKVLVGRAPAATDSVKLPSEPAALSSRFGGPNFVAVNRPLATQREVDAAATAIADQIASAFAEADGVARGNQKLKAGLAVSVSLVGTPFCGKYTLTQTRHVFAPHHEYLTHFTVSGRQERSLLGVVSMGSTNGSASAGGPPVTGVVIAQVTGNDDPAKLGRVKLRFPWLSDDYESDWARVAHLGAGPDSGAIFLPEVGDEVLVAFDGDDIRYPYVLGALWSKTDFPPDHNADGKNQIRLIKTPGGHLLKFVDRENEDVILIQLRDGKKVEIKSEGIQIDDGANKIILDAKAGTVSIEAKSTLTLKAPKIAIEASATLDIKGGQALSANATIVRIN